MNKETTKRLHSLIVEAGAYLQPLLPPHPAHPRGRIAIAHIFGCIQSVFGVPMRECRDERADDIIEVVQFIIDNPKYEGSVSKAMSHIQKEPVYRPVSLENFL